MEPHEPASFNPVCKLYTGAVNGFIEKKTFCTFCMCYCRILTHKLFCPAGFGFPTVPVFAYIKM